MVEGGVGFVALHQGCYSPPHGLGWLMFDVEAWISSVPPIVVYLLVGLIIGVESMGVPLPGETTLVAATLLSARPDSLLNPWFIGIAGATGAIVGDSMGYTLGRVLGPKLIRFLRRFFPKHFSPEYVAYAEHLFSRWGMPTVFFGRFIALLRIMAGPLAGVLHMPYRKFLLANAAGGIVWCGGTTTLVYTIGVIAEEWLKFGAWGALVVLLVVGAIASALLARRLDAAVQNFTAEQNTKGDLQPH